MTRSIRVLVAHKADVGWPAVRRRLESLAGLGYLQSLAILTISESRTIGQDPSIEVAIPSENGGIVLEPHTLLGYLASLGSIEEITTVAIRCDSALSLANSEISTSFEHALDSISSLLVRFATGVKRRDFRIAVIGESEVAPGAPFFSSAATINAIVLPRDISMNRAVARPVMRDNEETFAAHAATEICSVLGLWASMDSSPLDSIENRPMGVRGYSVHFVSSRVKGLLAPPLPVSELVDDSGVLPLPRGFTPVDNISVVVERFAEHVFPVELKFTPLPESNDYIRKNWRQLARDYVREFGQIVLHIPSILRRGFVGEVDAVGARVLDRLLGEADTRVRPIIPGNSVDAAPLISENLVDEIIRDIEHRDGRPVSVGLSTERWDELIAGILGIADGGESARASREAVMPSSILVADKSYVAPSSSSVAETIRALMPPSPAFIRQEVDESESETSEATEESIAGELHDDDEIAAVPVNSEAVVFTGDIDLEVLREAVRRSGMARPEINNHDNEFRSGDEGSAQSIQVDRLDNTLLGRITRRFDDEYRKAEDSTVECLSVLRTMPAHFGSGADSEVSWTVILTIALSLTGIIVSLATHGLARDFFGLDWINRRNRDFLWVGFSSIVIVGAVAALISSGRRSWQARAVLIALVSAGLLAIEFVAFDSIRDRVLKSGWGNADASAAIVIFVATLITTSIAIRKNGVDDDPIRNRVARFLALVLWIYVTVALSSFIAGPESFIVDWADSTRHKLLIAIQFVAWACLAMAVAVLVSIRVRQQNMFGRFQARFVWAQLNLTHSIDARRYLRVAYTHWLILSSVLGRMIWHPLGKEASEQLPFDGTLTGDESILKFDLAEMQLSEEGRIALLAQLKQRFVREGWLKVQFDIARNAYQTRLAFVTGDSLEDHDPIGCSSVPMVESLLSGDAQGDRFQFATSLHEGTFDERLLSGATNENLENVYSGILKDERMHEVHKAQNAFLTGFDFLSDIVPAEPSRLPPRVLSTLQVAGADATTMKSHLWWPESSIVAKPPVGVAEVHSGPAISPEQLNDSVVLLAILVDVSQPFANSDVQLLKDDAIDSTPLGGTDFSDSLEFDDDDD